MPAQLWSSRQGPPSCMLLWVLEVQGLVFSIASWIRGRCRGDLATADAPPPWAWKKPPFHKARCRRPTCRWPGKPRTGSWPRGLNSLQCQSLFPWKPCRHLESSRWRCTDRSHTAWLEGTNHQVQSVLRDAGCLLSYRNRRRIRLKWGRSRV